MLKMRFFKLLALVLIASFLSTGCKTMSNTGKGAAIGVGAGALL